MTKYKKYNKKGGYISTVTPSSTSSSGFMSWMSNAWNNTKKNSEGLFNKLSESTKNIMKSETPNSSLSSPPNQTPSVSSISYSNNSTTGDIPSNRYVSNTSLPLDTSKNTEKTMQGGKTRRKSGGSSISNTAAPVYHSDVAKPTYWIGGKTRNKRRRSNKKSNRKTKTNRRTGSKK